MRLSCVRATTCPLKDKIHIQKRETKYNTLETGYFQKTMKIVSAIFLVGRTSLSTRTLNGGNSGKSMLSGHRWTQSRTKSRSPRWKGPFLLCSSNHVFSNPAIVVAGESLLLKLLFVLPHVGEGHVSPPTKQLRERFPSLYEREADILE